jgi:hypothetical protein
MDILCVYLDLLLEVGDLFALLEYLDKVPHRIEAGQAEIDAVYFRFMILDLLELRNALWLILEHLFEMDSELRFEDFRRVSILMLCDWD